MRKNLLDMINNNDIPSFKIINTRQVDTDLKINHVHSIGTPIQMNQPEAGQRNWKPENYFEIELDNDFDSDIDLPIYQKYKEENISEIITKLPKMITSQRTGFVKELQYMACPTMIPKEVASVISGNWQIKPRNDDSIYTCKLCTEYFESGQALGGHMSRKHAGGSEKYIDKLNIRKERDFERKKLLLAKRKHFRGIGWDYDALHMTEEGRRQIRQSINRSKIKKIKDNITVDEFDKEFK